MNRKLPVIPIILGVLAMIAVITATVKFVTTFDQKMSFKSPTRQTVEVETPRDQALADRAADTPRARISDKPYEEAEYRAVPAGRLAGRDLGRRPVAPAVRGFRAGGTDLRCDHRVHRLAQR